MIDVTKEGILIGKTGNHFENEGVLNPGVIQIGDVIHVFYRAVSTGNVSTIGYCRLSDPLTVERRMDTPFMVSELPEESRGMEDPRIVKIDDTFYLTYTAYDGVNALGALATSNDLIHFHKKGVIVPQVTYDQFLAFTRIKDDLNKKYSRYNDPKHHYENKGENTYIWDKNLIFFPRRIDGKLCFMHRIKPDMQIVVSISEIDDLTPKFWEDYLLSFTDHVVLAPKFDHEINYIGGGCPPIETEAGWLIIYHGVHDTAKGYVYSACAALLDIRSPHKELARLPYPLFYPEKTWELKGEVNNVCFPTGTAQVNDTLARSIEGNDAIRLVVIQHEFGLYADHEPEFIAFIRSLTKPVLIVFHTVIPNPSADRHEMVRTIAGLVYGIIVMTQTSARILQSDYGLDADQITLIPHGTHLVAPIDTKAAKKANGFEGRTILSTFGLLGSGKSIETTLNALPSIISKYPNVLFLAIGKTHPSIIKHEGEVYREMLEAKVTELGLQHHVRFINEFLPLPDLLTYLQMTDIYLFTSKDPNQSVSGTFAYALSCGCPIVSTPIPHAKEVLNEETGVTFDFGNAVQLAVAVNRLLADPALCYHFGQNGLHAMAPTAWENSAIAHATLFSKHCDDIRLSYALPKPNLAHIRHMTTDFGMIQFSIISQPDLSTGYTLDDNARALIAVARHYANTGEVSDLALIRIYLDFIRHCQQEDGTFLNYVDADHLFTAQNADVNLDDSNGRAVWALGVVISLDSTLPDEFVRMADDMLDAYIMHMTNIHSTRAMAFMIKGLYYRNTTKPGRINKVFITTLADRLVQMFRHEADSTWTWFERYLTYGNSVIPEALLLAWKVVKKPVYVSIARSSFDFLMKQTFDGDTLRLISNVSWMRNGDSAHELPDGGEQPIEVAYTVSALKTFHDVFPNDGYDRLKTNAFQWFLGNNRMHQIVYNPRTGGCYDGLEDGYLNLNQGAESTVSYLIARMAMEPAAALFAHPKRVVEEDTSHRLRQVVR